MAWQSKYKEAANFTNKATFRLFDKPDWPNGFGNYPYFGDEGEVSPVLEMQITVILISGSLELVVPLMKVDLYNLKVEMSQ